MADWLGGLMQGWPVWLVGIVAAIVGVVWMLGEPGLGLFEIKRKKEWWQDEAAKRNKATVQKGKK